MAAHGIVRNQGIELDPLAVDATTGVVSAAALDRINPPEAGQDYAALVIAQPNFFGRLEDVDALTCPIEAPTVEAATDDLTLDHPAVTQVRSHVRTERRIEVHLA